MKCPNCKKELTIIRCKNNLAVDHCSACGGTFFKENEINRLTISDAHKLARLRQKAIVSGDAKLCPRDKSLLAPIKAESIPQFVTLLKCDECRGIFAYPDDLVNFKQAQEAKINYFKTWSIPFPSVRAVLVFSFVLFFSVSVYYTVNPLFKTSAPTRAGNELCALQVSKVGESTIVYCATVREYVSDAVLKNDATGQTVTREINVAASKAHLMTLSADEIAANGFTSVQFVFKTADNTSSTDYIPLQRP